MIYKTSVPTSQKTQAAAIMKTTHWKEFRLKTDFYRENDSAHKYTVRVNCNSR
jgi:hypothetical protein